MEKRMWALRLTLLAGSALVVAACNPLAVPLQPAAAPPQPMTVETARAATDDISLVLSYAGSLQAKDSVKIAPLVSGRVVSVTVQLGDVVKAGDVIATIEKDVYDAQVRQAEAAYRAAQEKLVRMQIGSRPEEIAAAQSAVRAAQVALDASQTPTDDQRTVAAANMAKAEAALKLAQHDYDKIAFAGQAGMTAQALQLQQATVTYQSAVAAYNLTIKPTDGQLAPLQNALAQAQLKLALTKQPYIDADLAQVQAAVDQARAALDLARFQLDNTTIRAPFDGVVAEVSITQGAMAGPSVPAVTLVSNAVEAVVNVDESRAGQIKPGQSAALRVAAMPGHDIVATVSAVAPTTDSKTHSFQIKVTPQDDSAQLRPGMYADVAILADEKHGVVVVPLAAVTQVRDQATVYVVEGGAAKRRQVTTGIADDTRIEILSGLQPGENVVTAGQGSLTDGAKVALARGS